jgi:hypothetical protein
LRRLRALALSTRRTTTPSPPLLAREELDLLAGVQLRAGRGRIGVCPRECFHVMVLHWRSREADVLSELLGWEGDATPRTRQSSPTAGHPQQDDQGQLRTRAMDLVVSGSRGIVTVKHSANEGRLPRYPRAELRVHPPSRAACSCVPRSPSLREVTHNNYLA